MLLMLIVKASMQIFYLEKFLHDLGIKFDVIAISETWLHS